MSSLKLSVTGAIHHVLAPMGEMDFLAGRFSRPRHFRRQGHQYGVDVAAGLEAEGGAAVVKQVELDIAAAADELVAALLRGPGLFHVAAHERGIDGEERLAHLLGEGEVALPVAAVDIVVEDTADAARLVAVLQKEILVAPLLEAGIVGRVMGIAGGFESG